MWISLGCPGEAIKQSMLLVDTQDKLHSCDSHKEVILKQKHLLKMTGAFVAEKSSYLPASPLSFHLKTVEDANKI